MNIETILKYDGLCTVDNCEQCDEDKLTDSEKILRELINANGDWVGDLYAKTHTMVHSRIADLRRKGHVIECECFGKSDYRYRLVTTTRNTSDTATTK